MMFLVCSPQPTRRSYSFFVTPFTAILLVLDSLMYDVCIIKCIIKSIYLGVNISGI